MNRLLGILLITLLGVMTLSAQPAPCSPADGNIDGKDVAACVSAAYPDKLVPTTTVEERQANMAFLRDRMIETARCAGMNVGLNLKRGGPSISFDFIVVRDAPGKPDVGVDIAGSYDAIEKPLVLGWMAYGKDRHYGFPTYKAYGPVSCLLNPPSPPQPDPVLELRSRVVELETMLQTMIEAFNNNANTLNALINEFTTEQTNRKAVDDEHNRVLDVLKSRPIPDGCKVQFFGCRLTFNAPVIQ